MKWVSLFTITVILILAPFTLFGQEMSPEQLEVWRLEESRAKYMTARDVKNVLAMYHQDFVGWSRQGTSPSRKSDIGSWLQKAIEEGREVPHARLRREAVEIFGDVAIVHFASSRSSNGKWIKVTHTLMRVGDTWKIIGGMSAPLTIENK